MKEDHTEVSHFQCLVSVYSGEFQFFSILLKQTIKRTNSNKYGSTKICHN